MNTRQLLISGADDVESIIVATDAFSHITTLWNIIWYDWSRWYRTYKHIYLDKYIIYLLIN